MLKLNAKASKVFAEAILNPPQPNEAAKAAAQRYLKYFPK